MKHAVSKRLVILLSSPLLLLGCGGSSSKEFWIYTSVYKEVYPLFEPGLTEAFPAVEFKWYQSGSEKIAAKILAEEKGGGTRADLLMTSDLFFYQELKKLGRLLTLDGPVFEGVPTELRDPDGAFAVVRIPLMVLAYHREHVTGGDVPTSFEDLLDPKYEGRLAMPSPLESGSMLTTVLYLYQRFGEAYFEGLRGNDVLSAGGNGSTLSRIQSGERPVGMVLLENILQAKQRGLESVEFVIPEEGALPIPSPLAIFEPTADGDGSKEELARRVLDWFLSPAAREVVVQGWMHTAFPDDPPPNGAPAFGDLRLHPWDLATFERWGEQRQEVKSSFQRIVLQ
ncbi:MAG: extracellular solute-binding protein [Thermoanaerobaculia bacterium]